MTGTLPAVSVVDAAPGSPAPAAYAWPSGGQAAVALPVAGYSTQSGPEAPVPVASLTKLMTAYVILRDHPLSTGTQGPDILISAADQADFDTDTVSDQANVELEQGEVLTEYQLLEGLLVHSANDFAYTLATWDAGSLTAFVQEMNSAAASLGMTQSHFADASGDDPSSESTAADLLKVASADMANPVFAGIVKMPAVTLPLAGTVTSYTPLLGTPGVVGVKSGFTSAAGGGDVLAYETQVGGRTVLALAAVVGQEGPTVLPRAGQAALTLAQEALTHLVATTVVAEGDVVADVRAGDRTVPANAGEAATVVALTGTTVHQELRVTHVPKQGAPGGTQIGTDTFVVGSRGTEKVTVPVLTSTKLP